MKISNLQIGDGDLHGRRFNGHDLHIALNERGVLSRSLVWTKTSQDVFTSEIALQFDDRVLQNQKFSAIQSDYSMQSQFNPFSYELLFNEKFLDSDIIHYHLIHNHFFSLAHLPILTKLKPTVWTLHDPWALAGHCIHPFDCEKWKTGCGNCPDLLSDFPLRKDTTALNWKLKEVYFAKSDFDVIVASQWMYQRVSASPLMKNKEIHLIPFGLNLDTFKPGNKRKLREQFGIPHSNFVICLRSISWGLKGFEYTKELLKLLTSTERKITIIAYNEKGLLSDFNDYFQIIDLGTIYDENQLALMYGVSDIFISTSLAESFGLSALESIACGTPVVAFDNTAITEVIEAPYAGIVVPATDIYSMKDAICTLMLDSKKLSELSSNARKLAESKYNKNDYVNRVIEVYKHVINKRGFNERSNFIIQQQKKLIFKRSNSGVEKITHSTALVNDQLINQKLAEITDSRTYILAMRMKNNKLIRGAYFYLFRPLYRLLRKIKHSV